MSLKYFGEIKKNKNIKINRFYRMRENESMQKRL